MDGDGRRQEEEVVFMNTLRAGEPDSDEELEAEIEKTERAIDDCFRRRAKRAGVVVGVTEGRRMNEGERDLLSEKLGDRIGARAKRRKEIEEMGEEAIGIEIKKMEETLRERVTVTGLGSQKSGLWSLPLAMTILCLIGGQASAFTTYDCSNKSNIIESY
jgi:hypothetical protein